MVTDSPNTMLQLVLDALPGQVAIIDQSGVLVAVNAAWLEVTSDSLVVRGTPGDNYLSTYDALMSAGIRDVLAGESPEFSFDYPGVIDGRVYWFNTRFRPFRNGEMQGALITHEDITVRMEDELARAESDRMLDSLIDASPLPIVALDIEGMVTRWNPAAERVFGWPADEVLGTFNPLISGDSRQEFHSNLTDALRTEGGTTVYARRLRKDGALVDVRIDHAGVFGLNGELRGAVAIFNDVSDENRAAERREFLSEASQALAVSLDYEETLASVARLAVPRIADFCAVNLVDDTGAIQRLVASHHDPEKNERLQAFVKTFEVPRDAPWGTAKVLRTGEPDIKHWPDDTGEQVSDQLAALREIGLRSALTVPMFARDRIIGTIVLIYGDSERYYSDADLEVAEGLAERAAAAIDNARLYREARQAEAQYRTIVEHVPAITYTARADDLSVLTFISSQTQLPDNAVQDGVVVDGARWLSSVHSDDVGRVRGVMAACSQSGEPMEVVYRVIYPDGEVSWKLDRANLIRDDNGNPLHWQGVVVDITERKDVEATLRVRALQQAAVASLGQRVVGDVDFDIMIADAVHVVQETLNTEFVSLATYNSMHETLEIRATAGRSPGTAVSKVVTLDTPSLLTYTFASRAPVIIENLEEEGRFLPWKGMIKAGVKSGLSVVIPGPERPYGVLLAASTRRRRFTADDVNFLQSIANLVSAAYEHYRDEEQVRFQAHLLDVISQAVIATDQEGRITYWNQHAETLYGWTFAEVKGKYILDAIPNEKSEDEMTALFARVLAGERWTGDQRMTRRDGSTFHGWLVLSPLYDTNGNLAGMAGVSADISERMQVNAERERLLRTLGERVKELTVLHRAAALFESDDAPLDLILCELAEMLPQSMQHPEKAAVRVEVGDDWAASYGYRRTPWAIRSEFALPYGEQGSIEICYTDPNPHDGAMLFLPEEYSLVDTVADMLLAYLQRIDSRQQLLRSETRFRAATEGTLDAFGILEPVFDSGEEAADYRFIEVNARAEVLLRLSREELIGNTLYELFLPQQAAMFVAAFNQVVATGETIEREVEVPRESDSFWMLFQAVPLEDGVACFASETTERRKLEDQLVHLAFHDTLTGLPNRALFLDRVEHARSRVRRRHEGIAVLFLDLDNFKIINDSLGHAAGDELLVSAAQRISGCIGTGDTAARFGGDEFAILLEDLSDWGSVTEMADTLIEAFQQPFTVMDREFYITPSIGVAIATSSEATATDLLRDADAAMYRAKRNGKARVEVFDPSLSTDVIARFELENDLRRAVERGEFSVVYQPIVRMESGKIAAMEALVRWDHPEHGQLSPIHFIPIAEETGLIIPIGYMVLEQACSDAVAWNRDLPEGEQIKVSVNISGRQFRHPVLVDQVISVLGSTGLPADRLYLEITESMMVDEIERASETMNRLRDLGVHMAVDDFGTGYSSLGSLRQFPVEVVKIDRVFVSGFDTNPQDAVMLASIIDLAHALDLRVVAEGVETASERDRLRAMGCDLAQGYLFSRPLPADQLKPIMQSHSDKPGATV